MNRRLLIVEPDASARMLIDRILTAAGYTVDDVEAAQHARILLDDTAYDLAVVDELAGGGFLDDVRWLRARYPRLPVIVTGTMLSANALIESMRLGVTDALPKPFTPPELRASVERALAGLTPGHAEALEFAAALAAARAAIAGGEPERAATALVRAYAQAPLDAELAALEALRAELSGRDADAERGYRAALALRHDEDTPAPDPYDGLARLASYGAARPVARLDARFDGVPRVLVGAPRELAPGGAIALGDEPVLVVFALGLGGAGAGATWLRQRPDRAFALLATDLRPESAARALAALGPGPLRAAREGDPARDELERLAELRDRAVGRSSA